MKRKITKRPIHASTDTKLYLRVQRVGDMLSEVLDDIGELEDKADLLSTDEVHTLSKAYDILMDVSYDIAHRKDIR